MSSSNYAETSSSSELTTMDETAASCLMLLSKVGELPPKSFECKTCGKTFSTFQALGGHRASHKKSKLDGQQDQSKVNPAKPRSHKCSICGAEFALGQALGGHMRRHRDCGAAAAPVLMRTNSKRVFLDLDLNLAPKEVELIVESDLKLELGKRKYEMDLEKMQEYDLRIQMGKRRRFGDGLLGLVV